MACGEGGGRLSPQKEDGGLWKGGFSCNRSLSVAHQPSDTSNRCF